MSSGPVFSFGNFSIDPASYTLRASGEPVQVEPRVLELLVYLIRHRERVVSKDELLKQLWPHKYVTESVLTRAIYEARRAVADDSQRQAIIKTVHSRGYQFVAPITEALAEVPPPVDRPEPPVVVGAPEPKRRALRPAGVAALAAALIAAVLVGIWSLRSPEAEPRERVAIAPFGVAEDDQDLNWGELALPRLVADVLYERADVVTFPANRVRQSLQQRGLSADSPEAEQVRALRDVFGVEHVLFGRIGRENGMVYVDYDLVGVDGSHRTGRASARGTGGLATSLAQSVAEQMDVAYAAGIPVRKISPNEFANEAFARGLNALLGGQLEDALRYFETTLASSPENGWARYESANVLSLLGHWDDASAAYEQARRSADADGDRNLAGAAASGLGTLAWRRGQLAEAERQFQTAEAEFSSVNRRANLASAVGNLGILADNRGQFELARERYETALALYRDEGERAGESATYSNLAVVERKLGRLDTAAQMQQRAIDLQREIGLREMLVFSLAHLGEIERGRGRWAQASPILDEAVAIARDVGYRIGEAEALTARGALHADLGRRDSAESDLRAARAIYGGLDNPHGDARSALQLSRLLRDSTVEEARQLAQHAGTVAERIGDEPLALEAGLLQVELGTGNASVLLPRLQALGDHRLLALNAAVRARRADDPAQQRIALQHAESAGDLRLQAELAVELARMLLRRGETRNIDALIGRAESWMRDYPPALATRACQLATTGRDADARRLLERARTAGATADVRAMGWCPGWSDAPN